MWIVVESMGLTHLVGGSSMILISLIVAFFCIPVSCRLPPSPPPYILRPEWEVVILEHSFLCCAAMRAVASQLKSPGC